MQHQPSVAVVILNWNGKKFLEQFLPFLRHSTYPNLEIIVADNASSDHSVQFLSENYPDIRIVSNLRNEGFAKGYNSALQNVNADYYVLLNSDVEVCSNWLEPVIELMESDSSIAACQPKILSWNQKDQFEYAGGAGGWLDAYGYPFCRGRVFDVCEVDKGQYDNVAPIFWSGGAAMFVKSKVFHELNGFDEFFFAHQEEIDLCWRIQLAGYKIFACPKSVVYHVGGGTLPHGNPRKVYLNFRNNLVMLAKNLTPGEKIWKIPFRILLDITSAVKNLFEGQTTYFGAVFRAHMAFYKWIFSPKDRRFFPSRRKKNLCGRYGGNVVWDYFVRRRRTFSEILRDKK